MIKRSIEVTAMRTMPRLLLLLFCMSVVTMMFIARCGLNMDSQLHNSHPGGLPVSSSGSPGERALREVMRRKEVEHIRDKTILQEKIKSLETELAKIQGQVTNLTANLYMAEKNLGRYLADSAAGNQNDQARSKNNILYSHDRIQRAVENGPLYDKNAYIAEQDRFYPKEGYQNNQNSQNLKAFNNGGDRGAELPNYPQRNEKAAPVFAPADSGKPVYNVDNNHFQFPNGDSKEQSLRQQADSQRFPNNNVRNSAERNVDFNIQPLGTGNNFMGMNVAEKHVYGITDEDVAVRGSVFPMNANNVRIERSPQEPGTNNDAKDSQLKFQSLGENNEGSIDSGSKIANSSGTFDYELYFQERLKLAEILKGQPYKTEYELIPFNRFIFNRIFMVDPGLGKRVVEKPIGSKKKDLNEILYHAVETLNKNRSETNLYTYDDFVEGIYRSDPATGSQYELFFSNRDDLTSKQPNSYVKLSVVRPFAPPMTVQHKVVTTGSEWINIILPLSKRLDTFRIFMDQFVNVCITRDKRIYLTVVYFGVEGLKEVKSIMGKVAKAHKFKHMKLVTLNETFARGRGLQIGALNWKGGGDVLLFFCDVDIVFTSDFLERCRLNSEKGQRVYYPIVFSLYNPKIVYSLQDVAMPSFQDQLVLSKDTGFWRDFGYGMTCQYRSDFLKIKGFDEQITGWGGEDVFLYQKFVRSDYLVVRATDPAIFHLWHEKYCDPTLSAEQYRSCIRSKALNEASHAQLGLLAFKDEIDVHRGISERNSILVRNAAVAENRDAAAANHNGN